MVTALRMFIRFLIAEGHCAIGLDAAIPSLAQWHLCDLPRYLQPEEVERVIAACNPATVVGMRDRESKPTAWCWDIQSSTACSGHSSMYKRTVGFMLIHDIQHQQKRRPGGRRNYCKRNCYVTFLRVDIPTSRRISIY